MNLTSLLLCFVFAIVGYFIHPIILPQLVEKNIVSKSNIKEKDFEEVLSDQPAKPISVEPEVDLGPRILDEPVDPIVDISENRDRIEEFGSKPQESTVNKPESSEVIQPEIVDEDPDLKSEEVLAMMKKSVKGKEVREFSFKSVAKWLYIGKKHVNGKEYQVGEVVYNEKTIFGNQELKALALFEDGTLVKWVWPTTHAEMK